MFGNYATQILGVIADEIEKQKGFYVEKYIMIYTAKNHAIEFKLNDTPERLPLDNPALADGIKTYIAANIPNGWELEFAFLFFNRNLSCEMSVHFVNDKVERKSEKTKL